MCEIMSMDCEVFVVLMWLEEFDLLLNVIVEVRGLEKLIRL